MSVDCGHLGTMLLLPFAAAAVPLAMGGGQLDLLAPDGDRQRQAAECVGLPARELLAHVDPHPLGGGWTWRPSSYRRLPALRIVHQAEVPDSPSFQVGLVLVAMLHLEARPVKCREIQVI
jgi:hypothetical protein